MQYWDKRLPHIVKEEWKMYKWGSKVTYHQKLCYTKQCLRRNQTEVEVSKQQASTLESNGITYIFMVHYSISKQNSLTS